MPQPSATHVPPQNIEAEESVLGAMLVAEPALTRVIDEVKLNAEDFYLEKHAAIFRAVHDLYAASKPVDELSVSEALVQRNEIEEAGGKHYVSELAAKVPAAGNAKHYAEIVQQNSLLRRLLGAGQEIQGWVHERDGEPRELSERAEKLLFDVAHKEQASDFRLLSEILHDEVDRLEKLSTGELEMTGTPSGFRDIDAITGGFQPGNLIIVAARPAMGKSAIVANIAENVAVKRELPVAFFSLGDVGGRAGAALHRLPGADLRRQAAQGAGRAEGLAEGGAGLQRAGGGAALVRRLLRPRHPRPAGEGAAAARAGPGPGRPRPDHRRLPAADALRRPARQPGRAGRPDEPRAEDPRPRAGGAGAGDLPALPRARAAHPAEADALRPARVGNLEQDADVVAFLYREDYYRDPEDEPDGLADVIIAKHRNGPIGTPKLVFLDRFPKFADFSGHERPVEQPAGEGPPLEDAAVAGPEF